ncbi:MAG: hypothetical protein M4579_002013 [Chaenotheca gracillima]|nr:MAG: hypothetical protein M4579_002013 [Chaenotheca gracillima]
MTSRSPSPSLALEKRASSPGCSTTATTGTTMGDKQPAASATAGAHADAGLGAGAASTPDVAVDSEIVGGYLFNEDRSPTKPLEDLLDGLARYIVANLSPPDSDSDGPALLPTQLAAFYRAVGGDYDALFLQTPHASLAFIYQSLGCLHSLHQPPGGDYAPPTVPALEPRGFVRWQCIQILLGPEEHAPFLRQAVREFDILNPVTGKRFPKEIPSGAFPDKPDATMTSWHDGIFERLEKEALDEQRAGTGTGWEGGGPSVGRYASAGDYFSSRDYEGPSDLPYGGYGRAEASRGREDILKGYRNVKSRARKRRPRSSVESEPELAEVSVELEHDSEDAGPHHRGSKEVLSSSSSSLSSGHAGDDDDDETTHERSSSVIDGSEASFSPRQRRHTVHDALPSSPPVVDDHRHHHHHHQPHHQHQPHQTRPRPSPNLELPSWAYSPAYSTFIPTPPHPTHHRRHSDIPISPHMSATSSPPLAPTDMPSPHHPHHHYDHADFDLATRPRFAHPSMPGPMPMPMHQSSVPTPSSFLPTQLPQPPSMSPMYMSHNPYFPSSTLAVPSHPRGPPPPRANYRGRNVRWSDAHSVLTFGGSSAASTPGSEIPSPFDAVEARRATGRRRRDRSRSRDRESDRDMEAEMEEEDERYYGRSARERRDSRSGGRSEKTRSRQQPQIRRLGKAMMGVDGRRYPVDGIVWR